MSIPKFPTIDPPLTTCDSLNMILASIAMEELGLSHIINAEGEKLQYVLGTLKEGCSQHASVEEVLTVNNSVKSLLDSIMQNQLVLKSKMECAVNALESGCCADDRKDCKGQSGSLGCCSVISFHGCPGQCWSAGKQLEWSRSECSKYCTPLLSSDRRKIILGHGKCYVVSFSVNLCAAEKNCDGVSISVQTNDGHKKADRFVYHVPIPCENTPFTATSGGIYISTHNCSCATELMLTLLSPEIIKATQSSICVMEI